MTYRLSLIAEVAGLIVVYLLFSAAANAAVSKPGSGEDESTGFFPHVYTSPMTVVMPTIAPVIQNPVTKELESTDPLPVPAPAAVETTEASTVTPVLAPSTEPDPEPTKYDADPDTSAPTE